MSESENEPRKKKQETEIKIEIDRSAEMERMKEEYEQEIRNLQSEKEGLENTLNLIAEKEIGAKCRKYGIDESLSDEQKINLVRQFERENQSTAPLNEAQITGQLPKTRTENSSDSFLQKEFDSPEDALREIKKEASKGNAEAQAVLSMMVKKALKEGKTVELEGQISSFEFEGFNRPAKRIKKDKKKAQFVPISEKPKEKD